MFTTLFNNIGKIFNGKSYKMEEEGSANQQPTPFNYNLMTFSSWESYFMYYERKDIIFLFNFDNYIAHSRLRYLDSGKVDVEIKIMDEKCCYLDYKEELKIDYFIGETSDSDIRNKIIRVASKMVYLNFLFYNNFAN